MMSLIDRLQQPEYTGENRCTPCTIVNIAVAGTGSALLSKVTSSRLGGTAFVASLGAIYLRGYLVPGTPTLTKRYFPNRVLRWFDKSTATSITDSSISISPEQVLIDANAVEICQEGTDLCLTPEFHEEWRGQIHAIQASDSIDDSLVKVLNRSLSNQQVTIEQQGDTFLAHTDNVIIGQWASQAALTADVASANELSERISNWSRFTPAEIARVLMSLRVFIEQCPECNGPVQVEQEVMESCCRSYDVVASSCQECGSRLFEVEWDNSEIEAREELSKPSQTSM